MKATMVVLGALLALAFLASNAAAAAFNFEVEVFSNNQWGYAATPYAQYNDGWYYFNSPYRYNYGGSYYNFEPGWYYYEPNWAYSPYSYSYYPSTYYNYGGNWVYDPYWSYWPYPQYYYSMPVYGGFTGWTGSRRTAGCGDIEIYVDDVRVNAGSSESATARITNNSATALEIRDMEVYIDSFRVSASDVSYPSTVPAHSSRTASFRVNAELAANGSVAADMKVAAQFGSGTYCGFQELRTGFVIFVVANPAPVREEQGYSYSESTITELNFSTSTWGEPKPGVSTVCPAEPSLLPTCSGLDLVAHDVTVQSTEIQHEDFWVKNYTSQNFHIENVAISESSNSLAAGTGVSDSIAYKDRSTAKLAFWVDAFGVESDEFTKARLTVEGRFENGQRCALSKEFYIYVNTERELCSGLNMEAPEQLEAEGSTAVVSVAFDNPTDYAGHLTISAENAIVSPSDIAVPAHTYAQRIVQVSGIGNGNAVLKYRAFAGKCSLAEKRTLILKEAVEAEAAIELVNYAPEVQVDANGARFTVVVRNSGSSYESVAIELVGLPQGFYVRNAAAELAPHETRAVAVEVLVNSVEDGEYAAVLKVSNGTAIEKPVKFIVGNLAGQGNGVAQPAQDSNQSSGTANTGTAGAGGVASAGNVLTEFTSAAMVMLGANLFTAGLVVLAIIVVLIAYSALRAKHADEPWVEK